jgi:hypothetical protein
MYRLHLQGKRNLQEMNQLPAHAGSLLVDFLYPEDGGDTFLWNVG